MLATVRATLTSGDVHPRAADHARCCLEAAREADAQVRRPDEAVGRRAFSENAADLRQAHRWARRHDPAGAAALSAAIHLHAHSALWAEPLEWSRELLAVTPDDLPGRAAVLAVVAAGEVVCGHLDRALTLATDALALADDDPVTIAVAIGTLVDATLFLGRLDESMAHADRLVAFGLDHGDQHAVTMGRVGAVLAHV